MSKNKKTILRSLLLALVALVIGVSIYSMNASRLAGNAVPMPFGIGASVVLSGSMEPELSVGDLLIIKEFPSYEKGNIVVFQDGYTAVVHKIISVDEENGTVTTKGTANDSPDDPIPITAIKGKVILAIPFVGYIVNVIKTPLGTLVLIGAALLLLERSFKKEKEKGQEDLDELRRQIEDFKQELEAESIETEEADAEKKDEPISEDGEN